ncbi:MAG: hypothetical protein DI535_02260 [Citrobacter freundii]|nr:MAG: hypothetical protein DI535_02260 [Citrobacter freundii]
MNPTEDFLNRIADAERGKAKGLRKFLRDDYSIKPTSDFSPFPKMVAGITSHTVRKSWSSRIGLLIFSFVMVLIFGNRLISSDYNSSTQSFSFFMLGLSGIALFVTCRAFFVEDEYDFSIFIDQNGIKIMNVLYPWNDIHETAFLYKSGGRSTTTYLILAKNDMVLYEKFDITAFTSIFHSEKKIARYIDYFRPKITSHKTS